MRPFLLCLGLLAATACLGEGQASVQLTCAMKSMLGESLPPLDVLIEESQYRVAVNAGNSHSATFTPASIMWTEESGEHSFLNRIDRYSGELIVFSSDRPIMAGICAVASKDSRKL